MNRFTRSWILFKSSLAIMRQNPQLVIFPVVISGFTVMIVLFFLLPVTFRPTGYPYSSIQHWQAVSHWLFKSSTDANGNSTGVLSPAAMGYLVFMYFVSMFFATFFNVAFYHEILAALKGDSVSIARGLRFACTRWKAVLMWTLFAGIVGLIIKQIEERMGIVSRIVGRLIGIAWSIASVFVIPIIVQDGTANPLVMLKTSAGILKETWGESLVGFVGIRLISGVISILLMGILLGAFVASVALKNYWIIGIAAPLWFLAVVILSYLAGVAGKIYRGALYLYAMEGVICEPYDQEMLDSAWKFREE